MANLTRFEPFSDLIPFDPLRGVDDLLRELRGPAFAGLGPDAIRLDVDETEQAYEVSAEIAGMRKEDIKIDIDGNRVAISAERKQESERKQGAAVRRERYWGQLYRSFTLQTPVDETKAEARYEDGVLKLTLPKKPGAAARRLSVQ